MNETAARILALGVVGILVLGSMAGFVLKHRVAKCQPHVVIDNLRARVAAWWVIAALLGLAMWGGRTGVCLLFALASLIALREFSPMPGGRRWERAVVLGATLGVLPVQYWLIWRGHDVLPASPALVYAWIVVPVVAVIAGEPRDLLRRIAPLQWGLMLCVLCVAYVPALLALQIPGYAGRNGYLLAFLLLVTQLGDVFQYLWGKWMGRRPLAHAISPAKTVEGTVGGVASATALGAMLAWITPFSTMEAAALALVVSLLGVLGGLTLSAIKRRRGIKDWGTLISGHGGVLDRLDSLCFSAPAFYYTLKFGWT